MDSIDLQIPMISDGQVSDLCKNEPNLSEISIVACRDEYSVDSSERFKIELQNIFDNPREKPQGFRFSRFQNRVIGQ